MNVYKKTRVFVSGRPFQPTPMFVGKAKSTWKVITNINKLWPYTKTGIKHSSSLQTFINYDGKKFCNIDVLLKTATTESDR